MNDFKKNNRFGGGGSDRRGGGRGGFGRPSFGGSKSFGGAKSFGTREFELFEAICASCGKTCKVPFKPNGKKPVYCKDCFAANGGPAASGPRENSSPRRDFSAPSSSYKSEYKQEGDQGLVTLRKQIEALGVKIDRIMLMLSEDGSVSDEPKDDASSASVAKVSKKPVEKKKK